VTIPSCLQETQGSSGFNNDGENLRLDVSDFESSSKNATFEERPRFDKETARLKLSCGCFRGGVGTNIKPVRRETFLATFVHDGI
jgi:hypothetical protein